MNLVNDKRYGTEEAAKILGVSAKTLANWRSGNIGPAFVKVGNSVWYYEADLESYPQSNKHVPAKTESARAAPQARRPDDPLPLPPELQKLLRLNRPYGQRGRKNRGV